MAEFRVARKITESRYGYAYNAAICKIFVCLVFYKYFHVSLIVESHHVVGLFTTASFHTRRSNRHTGHSDARDIRPKQQQLLDVPMRNMPLDDIAVDNRGVAGGQFFRHAKAFLDRKHVAGMLNRHVVVVTLQIANPFGAAAALRIFINNDILRCNIAGRTRGYGE